ncbi:MAG: PD40 domain-containing protein [Acidobacteriia bacterium]|nr:PD40 domain-containing protein [Terriglobia bacterium]
MNRNLLLRVLTALWSVALGANGGPVAAGASAYPPAPPFYPDQPECRVKSIRKLETTYEGIAKSPAADVFAISEPDSKGVNQIYLIKGDTKTCITCEPRPGAPRVDRNKMMITWHPSSNWLIVGVEEDKHDNQWMPKSWQRGFLQSGIWLNMWATTATGDRWYQITDFKKSAPNPSGGFVGTPFTPDGKKAAWAEIVDGNILANHFGVWRLYLADFSVGPQGTPSFIHKKDITPAGARWVEPGNFSPDGRHLLLSTDIGLRDAYGQDQWSLDIATGALQQLTNTPNVWDEHGLYSPNGKKIIFMSSYPYRDQKDSYKVTHLATEFMLMDADGSHLQQLTHFNVPGYPESQKDRTIAAIAAFSPDDGSQMLAFVMGPNFSKTNWQIVFEGNCGGR